MGKDRTITGFGVTKIGPLTHTASSGTASIAGGWIPFGPFKGNTLGTAMVFAAATSGVFGRLQAAMTTDSSGTWVSMDNHDGADATVQSVSTSVLFFNRVRLISTAKGTSTSVAYGVTAYIASVPGK